MSLVPPHLQARWCSVVCHTIFSVSLRTWIALLRIHECLRRNEKWVLGVFPPYVSTVFCFWLSVNSLPFSVNGYSEGRWPIANVGVHSCISTKASSTSRELLYFVYSFSHAKMNDIAGGHLLLLYSMALLYVFYSGCFIACKDDIFFWRYLVVPEGFHGCIVPLLDMHVNKMRPPPDNINELTGIRCPASGKVPSPNESFVLNFVYTSSAPRPLLGSSQLRLVSTVIHFQKGRTRKQRLSPGSWFVSSPVTFPVAASNSTSRPPTRFATSTMTYFHADLCLTIRHAAGTLDRKFRAGTVHFVLFFKFLLMSAGLNCIRKSFIYAKTRLGGGPFHTWWM